MPLLAALALAAASQCPSLSPRPDGARWTYEERGERGSATGGKVTATVTAGEEDGAWKGVLRHQVEGMDAANDDERFSCDGEALRVEGMSSAQGSGLSIDLITGLRLPARVKPGDRWKMSVLSTLRGEGHVLPMREDTAAHAIGWEKIEVPAGAFRALHVRYEVSTTLGDPAHPLRRGTGTYDEWLAEGVGLVRRAAGKTRLDLLSSSLTRAGGGAASAAPPAR